MVTSQSSERWFMTDNILRNSIKFFLTPHLGLALSLHDNRLTCVSIPKSSTSMFHTPTPNPRLDCWVRWDRLQSISSWKSTMTPIKYSFTTTQARNQRFSFQEPIAIEGANSTTKEITLLAELKEKDQENSSTLTQPPYPRNWSPNTIDGAFHHELPLWTFD